MYKLFKWFLKSVGVLLAVNFIMLWIKTMWQIFLNTDAFLGKMSYFGS